MELLRADDEVDVRQAIEQFGAAVLRHAAEDPEDEVRLLLLPRREVAGLADGLLLGGVAHAAGIEQEHIAIVLIRHDAITPGTQQRRDGFAVALVHLAAVGLDVNPVHRGTRRAEARRAEAEGLTTHPPRPVNAGKSSAAIHGPDPNRAGL